MVFNLEGTDPSQASYVTAYPDTRTRPVASNPNFLYGQTLANWVIVPVVPVVNGHVDLYNSQGAVQWVVDINGYYTNGPVPSASGSDFNSVAPARIVDTRPNSGIPYSGATLPAGDTLLVQVAGSLGVPAMSSSSPPTVVVLNLTAVNASARSHVTVWPSNVARPGISDVNFLAGQIQPNLVVVQLSPLGRLSF